MTDFTETRSMLKKLAMAHGADTPIGRACRFSGRLASGRGETFYVGTYGAN